MSHILGDRTDQASFQASLAGRDFDAVVDQQAYPQGARRGGGGSAAGQDGPLRPHQHRVHLPRRVSRFLHNCPFPESALDHSRLSWDYPAGESEYGAGKRHCEKYLVEHPEFPSTMVRVPAVMGPADPTGRMWFFVQRALDGGPCSGP